MKDCGCRDFAPCGPCLSESLARVALLSERTGCDPALREGEPRRTLPARSLSSDDPGFSVRVPEAALPDPVGSLSGMFLDERFEVRESEDLP